MNEADKVNLPNWPKVEKFLSPDEIVEVLFDRFKANPGVEKFIKGDPVMFHHGTGTAIRNEFWLWHPENPHTMKDYKPQLDDRGVDMNPRHADNTSGYIMRKLHDRLKTHRESTTT